MSTPRLCGCGCASKTTDRRCWACGRFTKAVPMMPGIPNAAGPREDAVGKVLVL